MARYAYALNKLLGIQIDAAINPGAAPTSTKPLILITYSCGTQHSMAGRPASVSLQA